MKYPKSDDFENGNFYRRWIRFHYLTAVVMAGFGLLNGYNLVTGIMHHSFSAVIAFSGLAVSVWSLWKTPRDVADVRRRWREMDELTRQHRNLIANMNNLHPKR